MVGMFEAEVFRNVGFKKNFFWVSIKYRVSHIILDRHDGSKLRFSALIRNIRRINHFIKLNKVYMKILI